MRLRYAIKFDASLEDCSVPLVMRFGSSSLFSTEPGAEPVGSKHLIKVSSEFVFNSQTRVKPSHLGSSFLHPLLCQLEMCFVQETENLTLVVTNQ